MATQTEKLGLDIWEAEDSVTMEGFNQNSRRLEEKLGKGSAELILEVTTQEAANAVALPMSGIDWTKYDYVYVDFMLQTDKRNGGTTYTKWRVNDSTATSHGAAILETGNSDMSLVTGCIGHFLSSGTIRARRIRFNVFGYPDNLINHESHYTDRFMWGYTGGTYENFSTLTAACTDSDVNIKAGANIKIWGVRA